MSAISESYDMVIGDDSQNSAKKIIPFSAPSLHRYTAAPEVVPFALISVSLLHHRISADHRHLLCWIASGGAGGMGTFQVYIFGCRYNVTPDP